MGAVVVGEVRVRVRREDRVHRGPVPPQARDAQRRVAWGRKRLSLRLAILNVRDFSENDITSTST